MDRRPLAGIGVLAAAVLVLAMGYGISRPLIVGAAQASPIDPAPRLGQCVYAGSAGPWVQLSESGYWDDHAHLRWFGPCSELWFAEVVAVRSQADIQADLAANRVHPGFDPCKAGLTQYLGRPVITAIDGWQAVDVTTDLLKPDRRQRAAGQRWQACQLRPLELGPGGQPIDQGIAATSVGAVTTESLRGRWNEVDVRNRFGYCESGPLTAASPVFCGAPHDRQILAWGSVEDPADVVTFLQACSRQAALLMQRDDPTAGGDLTVEVGVYDADGVMELITAGSALDMLASASCVIRSTDPTRQLTSTVVGLGTDTVPLTTR